jgi:hypothetical protein
MQIIIPEDFPGLSSYVNDKKEIVIQTNKNGFFKSEMLPVIVNAVVMLFLLAWIIAALAMNIFLLVPFGCILLIFIIRNLIFMIDSVYEYQRLTVSLNSIRIEKKRPVFSKDIVIQNIDTDSICTKKFGITLLPDRISFRYLYKRDMTWGTGLELPIICTKEQEVFFFENRSMDEQRWVLSTLRQLLSKESL